MEQFHWENLLELWKVPVFLTPFLPCVFSIRFLDLVGWNNKSALGCLLFTGPVPFVAFYVFLNVGVIQFYQKFMHYPLLVTSLVLGIAAYGLGSWFFIEVLRDGREKL